MDKDLPIGSVVRVKEKSEKYIIVGKNVDFNNSKYDYMCAVYPYGYSKEKEFSYFNHNELVSLVFLGDING